MTFGRRLWINTKTIAYATAYAAKRNPATTLFYLGVVVVLILAAADRPTPEQVQVMREAERRAAASQAEIDARRVERAEVERLLCRIKSACKKYSVVRQECAPAGNFTNCIQVKMGNDADLVSSCKNDGSILLSSSDVPSYAACLHYLVSDYFFHSQ